MRGRRNKLLLIAVIAIVIIGGWRSAWPGSGNDEIDALAENVVLRDKVMELEAQLDEVTKALEASTKLLEELDAENQRLHVLVDDQARRLDAQNKRWLFGGAIQYPWGVEAGVGYVFDDWVGMLSAGYHEGPYIELGVHVRR